MAPKLQLDASTLKTLYHNTGTQDHEHVGQVYRMLWFGASFARN